MLEAQCGSYGATPLNSELEDVGIESDLEVESKIEWLKSRHNLILEGDRTAGGRERDFLRE